MGNGLSVEGRFLLAGFQIEARVAPGLEQYLGRTGLYSLANSKEQMLTKNALVLLRYFPIIAVDCHFEGL